MRTITSCSGREEAVSVRRTESADAQGINSLISPAAGAVFGRVNVIHLLEKANLAVTLANEREGILAHASFFDHPVGDLVDQTRWEPFLQKYFSAETCTPLNTLFLHLFVAEPDFATASAKEIMRAVFNAVPELEHICLLSPYGGALEPALEEVFDPLQRQTNPEPQCSAFICHREELCPKLQVRPARVEDHDDLMRIFLEQTKLLSVMEQPYFLAELIQGQNKDNHCAVCESDGVPVGFISVTSDVDLKCLHDSFDLSELDGLYKLDQMKSDEPAAQPDSRDQEEEEEPRKTQTKPEEETEAGHFSAKSNAVCVQFFVIDKNYETRSVDFIPYIFTVYPDVDFLIVTVPTLSPEFLLLQSFIRLPPCTTTSPPRELYVFPRSALRPVEVRPAVAADRPAVSELVNTLSLGESLLQDLDHFYQTRGDQDGVPLQAFVAAVQGEVVGVLIIRDEQDIRYMCARYNMENFIYFSHHRREEHAHILHFVLAPSSQHCSRHLFKEALRLGHKSCLFHRLYPPHLSPQNSCVHHLDFLLDCAVPVHPRRQIVFPLEELGINAPSRQISEEQAPFALSLVSRKLTLEPKVTVNARIVVVGASDTGLSFLEVLCFCPHLRFNSLTLVSTHGLLDDYDHEDVGFLSTRHAYSSRDLSQLPLHSCISVVSGKMVGIDRKSKRVLVFGGVTVPYDHLVLCTGLQYQAPRLTDVNQPNSNIQLPVPSNLFTLNDLHDCMAARRWLSTNFVELEDNAIVYGNSLDVFTTVETLLSLGILGNRIHVVLTPPEPNVSCFSDPEVEKAVATALKKAKVQVHHHCLLALNGEHPDPLTSVTFNTDAEPLLLQCGVFINLSNKAVDSDVFRSINSSFLVFDSRLVIDATFHTSDPSISAAGPLTIFSRSCYTDEWSHASFDSKEVGRDLAAMLLRLFDPTLEPAGEATPETHRLVPLYKEAKIQGGKLPGGFHFLQVTKPSATNLSGPPAKQDGSLVTGRVETGNYFSLHLDCYERVEALTCLSLKPLPLSNYLSLYGKQQQLLGRLSSRYQQGLIPDLYSFFRQSWCLAVYHDRFSDFEQELRQITSNAHGASHVLRRDRFSDAEVRAAVRSSAVRYLSYNRNLLPMFAGPGQL
ncbi:hypothetical protein PBY51_006418 [Eleginops maclovinus]|uniref:Cilia- and flagella-associated protein 61 N-terminal domain-containing protein n=1 Tax=Eleginops maclovinus TaxID=56733 RepID=A0AAN7X468_ELEMC|nr:hypothetical protein PBY51_006418 [Eleginops maclovinus]